MDGGAWQATVHGVSKRDNWVTKHVCMQEKVQEDIAFLYNFEETALSRPYRCRVDDYPGTNSSNQFDSCGQDIVCHLQMGQPAGALDSHNCNLYQNHHPVSFVRTYFML